MPCDIARASLYRGAINLWVEVELSREYLSSLWNNPSIAFFIAGGNEGVRAVVTDAQNTGLTNVFGLIDRDFRPTNHGDWESANKTFCTFILPVHEIENDLLDPAALAASRLNTLNQTQAQIEDHLRHAAEKLTWWAACREVVAELKRRFRHQFLPDPPCGTITDEITATDHICASRWFRNLSGEVARSGEVEIRQLLAIAHTMAQTHLADGKWRVEFAGKEIYRDIGSRICDRRKLPGYQPTPVEFDVDLAKEIAAWQAEKGAVPTALVDLLEALKKRIARTPPSV